MNLDANLAQLESTELVRRIEGPEWAFQFKHALTQDAAYQSLLRQTRREIHRRVAESLEQLYPEQLQENAALLAQRYASAGDAERTARYTELAGDAAAYLFAYPEARLQYAGALNALDPLPLQPDLARRRVDLLIKYVSVALRLDGPERALKRLADAEALFASIPAPESREDRARRARIAFWQGDAHLHKSQPGQAVKYMHQVLEIVEDGVDDETLAAIPANVMGRALAVQGQFARAQPLLERAVPALQQTFNWSEWVLAKGFLGLSQAMRGEIQAALAQTSSALARVHELGTLAGVADSYVLSAMALMQAGEYAKALNAARASIEHAQQLGDQLVMYIALNWRAWAELRLGALDAASAGFSQARHVAAVVGGQLVFADWFKAAEAELELAVGAPENALARAQGALEFGQTVGSVYSKALAHRLCGQALIAQRQFDAACEHWNEALQMLETGDARLEIARTRAVWGDLLARRGEFDSARAYFEQAAAQFEASGLTRELGAARQRLAELK
jgi:tetratricopeptide (TPR) repeat protein